jgi:YD repeat-containing protein
MQSSFILFDRTLRSVYQIILNNSLRPESAAITKAGLVCLLFSLMMLVFSIGVIAQQNSKVDNLIPPSPESSALAKYAQIPVGHYTGVPEISIPLVNVQEGNLTLPISLSYHASGNKVEEIASRVGMGWVLNAGGSIMRTVVGEADESPMGFLNTTYNFLPSSILNGTSQTSRNALWAALVGCADAEPDRFTFNFNGYVGTFGFEWNSDQNYDIQVSSSSRMKVQALHEDGNVWTHGNYSSTIHGFKVTTADGTIYLFRSSEKTYHRILHSRTIESQQCTWSEGATGFPPPATSSWHLTKIISPNGNEINLDYENYSLEYCLIESETKYHRTGSQHPPQTKRDTARMLVQGKYLRNITTSSGSTLVEFIPTAGPSRTDLPLRYDKTSNELYSLGEIKVKSKIEGVNKLVTHYRLLYNYEIGRLTLKSITDLPSEEGATSLKPPMRFSYNTLVTLPPFSGKLASSYKQDHWGFANGNTILSLVPKPSSARAQQFAVTVGANRAPSSDSTKAGILVDIQYSTGGFTKFDYEIHDYGAIGGLPGMPAVELASAKTAGGVRVKQITDKKDWQSEDRVRQFKYKLANGKSSGVIAVEPVYEYDVETYDFTNGNPFVIGWEVTFDWIFTQNVLTEPKLYLARPATSSTPLGMTQGSHIGYREVTELIGSDGIGGKSVFHFSSFFDHNDDYSKSGEQPHPTPIVYDYQRGLLTERGDYESVDGAFIQVKKSEYKYDSVKFGLHGIKIGEQYPGSSQSGLNMFAYASYSYALGASAPVRKTETLFKGGQAYVTEERYTYDLPLQFLRKQSVKTSDGKELITEFIYPMDYSLSSPPTVINEMTSRHILSPVIEQIEKEKNGIDEKVTGAWFTEYGFFNPNNIIEPHKQHEFIGPSPVEDFHPSVSNSGNRDSRYHEILTINKYTLRGKPEETTTPAGVISSFFWGYDGNLPIARVTNASQGACAFANFETGETGNWIFSANNYQNESKTGKRSNASSWFESPLLQPGQYLVSVWAKSPFEGEVGYLTIDGNTQTTDHIWKRYEWIINISNARKITLQNPSSNTSYIDDLRLHSVNAQMQTYTYDPGIGMTSYTDENNQITFYEYDSFGRLQNVKDREQNIRQNYKYHYKN